MDIPRVPKGDRSGDVEQSGCKKCGRPIVTTKQGIQCPRCDKLGAKQTPGGYQAQTTDGRTLYFDTEKELTDFLGRRTPRKPVNNKTAKVKSETPQLDQSGVGTLPSAKIAFELIDRELQSAQGKVDKMSDIKKILALRKKLNGIKFDVENIIGE